MYTLKEGAILNSRLIGREKEIDLLDQYYSSDKSELIAIYGRRRVGKTFLVRETLGRRIDFEFTGLYQSSGRVQRTQFQKELNRLTSGSEGTPSDWFEMFDRLRAYLLSLDKDKVTVFLDELPWMDTARSDFLTAFSQFWNSWGRETVILKLFVCGSATTWMLDKLIGDRGGLYGRINRAIYLAPFSLHETDCFLNKLKKMNYNQQQVLDAYMVFGGIPYYLDMLDPVFSFSVNVDMLFFAENAPLKTEFLFLFRSLFKKSQNYRRVIEYLSSKMSGLTREEITAGTKLTGGELSKILSNLNACDFIRCYADPVKKERRKVYQLTDMFSLFHLRFVQRHDGQDQNYWTNLSQSGKKNAWTGYAFEQVCLHHIPQIRQALGITGVLTNVYAWKCKPFSDADGNEWKDGQIDLVIDRSDKVMNLCEMKYAQSEFVIDKELFETIRNRTELFRREQKTRKNLRCTFVTLYGVKQNHYSGIVNNQIILNDLFR